MRDGSTPTEATGRPAGSNEGTPSDSWNNIARIYHVPEGTSKVKVTIKAKDDGDFKGVQDGFIIGGVGIATGPGMQLTTNVTSEGKSGEYGFTKDKLAAKTVAVMSNNSSDYSDGVANAFVAEAEKQGIQVVAREGYSDGDKDFKAQLTKIAQQNPDVLFIPDYYEQDGLIAIQAREVGLKSVIVGSDGWDGVVKTVDPSSYAAIENVYFANHYSTKDSNERIQNFIKNYKAFKLDK